MAETNLNLINQLREQMKAADDQRDEDLPTQIPEVKRLNDIIYGLDPQYNLLDLYLPRQRTSQGKIPVIVNIHGGGWIYGTKETYQFYGLALAKAGFAVVNANYRLAPQVHYPAELTDINQVFQWLCHALQTQQYQLDLGNVFVIGDSAGAQMAEQILAVYSNADYRKFFGYKKPDLTIKAAALNCGAYFLPELKAFQGAPEAYFPPEVRLNNQKELQVERYLTSALPPLFLMTCTQDFLRHNTYMLAGYLTAKEIYYEIHEYGEAKDPREHDFQINQKDPLAQQCTDDELNFFRRYLN